jgi:hypothetical protein
LSTFVFLLFGKCLFLTLDLRGNFRDVALAVRQIKNSCVANVDFRLSGSMIVAKAIEDTTGCEGTLSQRSVFLAFTYIIHNTQVLESLLCHIFLCLIYYQSNVMDMVMGWCRAYLGMRCCSVSAFRSSLGYVGIQVNVNI